MHRVSRRCGNAYIREERLSDLLCGVVDKIQLPEQVADSVAQRLRTSQADLAETRERSSARRLDRQRALQAKIDRGYDVKELKYCDINYITENSVTGAKGRAAASRAGRAGRRDLPGDPFSR